MPLPRLLPLSSFQVKNLRYLNATIDEGLRMFATNAFGLPRVVPAGTIVTIEGKAFQEGVGLPLPPHFSGNIN